MTVFSVVRFEFPYDYKFPGQASNERILFVTRENAVMLWVRRLGVMAAGIALFLVGLLASTLLAEANAGLASLLWWSSALTSIVLVIIGWWWVTQLWQKSLMLVTTQRLLKFIYTTPFNRHVLSLPLEMIVDTGAYSKGFIQALFRLGTLTARSSASSSGVATDDDRGSRINKKYFYIENVMVAEDLQHYLNKVLQAFRQQPERLGMFRPFIPHLKGEQRKSFMAQFPELWS